MADGDLVLAGDQQVSVTIPQEVGFWMREKDWARIRGNVQSLEKAEHQWAALAWAGVGVAGGAIFGILGWIAPWVLLTDNQREAFAWIWVALVALAVIGALAAVVGFIAAKHLDGYRQISVSVVLSDMDNVHPAATT